MHDPTGPHSGPQQGVPEFGLGVIPNELESAIVEAARYRTGNNSLDAFLMQSLVAGVANSPELSATLQSELAPEQVQLDLHLTGESVQHHATNANTLGDFISHLSDAVKETAKAIGDKRAWRNNLLVSGVQPGSVRVILQVPEARKPRNSGTPELTESTTLDSQAVRAIAQTMSTASQDEATDDDEVVIARIPKQARRALRLAALDVKRAGWDIEGSISQRGRSIDPVRLTHRGAERLVTSLNGVEEVTTAKETFGVVDGVKNSLGHVFIIPETGNVLTLSSTDDKRLAEAARLAATPGTRVRVFFDETRSLDAGGAALPTVSRTLTHLQRATVDTNHEEVPLI
jgi:hypothetical protein